MDAIKYVQSRGIGLYVDGDQLKAFPRQRLTPEIRSFIKDHRRDLIERLATPTIDVTVGNILVLTPEEIEALRGELAGATDDDSWTGFDREAFGIAERTLQRRHEMMEGSAAS